MPVRFQLPARMGHTDEELAFIREMGIRYLNLNVMPPQANEEDLQREKERLARFDLEISDLACPPLQKKPRHHSWPARPGGAAGPILRLCAAGRAHGRDARRLCLSHRSHERPVGGCNAGMRPKPVSRRPVCMI